MRWKLIVVHSAALALMTSTQAAAQATKSAELLPAGTSRLLYLDHIAERGIELFRVACERDLEGIVAKWAHGTYQTDRRSASWLKVKNAHYSQMAGRRKLFDARRDRRARRREAAIIAPSLVLA